MIEGKEGSDETEDNRKLQDEAGNEAERDGSDEGKVK